MDELPLLELFTHLREAGMPLGIKDYELALQALQGGYGLSVSGATPAENRAALARLCRTLWVRSSDEQRLLDIYFEQLFGHEETIELISQPKRRILQRTIISLVSLLLLGSGVGVWLIYRPSNLTLKPSSSSPSAGSTQSPGQSASATPNPMSPSPQQTHIEQIIVTATATSTGGMFPLPQQTPTAPPAPSSTWMVWSFSIMLVLGVGIWGVWWFFRDALNREADQPSEPEANPSVTSELLHDTEDEIQLAQAVRQLTLQKDGSRDRFMLSVDYLPVTQRQMKQSWRHLRQMIREGIATELDIEATVRQIAHDGMLLEPKLIPRRVNRTELVLLIDQDGSMVPFHSLSARLAETAQRGGRLGQAGIYYFHNCPVDYLYNDLWHQQAEPIPAFLSQLRRDRTVVLIVSDAGAARGGLNFKRVSLTRVFLKRLRQHVRYVAWLNPMPKNRWAGTTAGELVRDVPIFEGTRQGVDQAIDVLRGRHILTSQPHAVTPLQEEVS